MSNQTINLSFPVKEAFNLIPQLANTVMTSSKDIAGNVTSILKDTEFSIGIELDGEQYGLCIKDGKEFELQTSDNGQPMIKLVTGVSDLEKLIVVENAAVILGGNEGQGTRGNFKPKLDTISSAKGALSLELKNDNDSTSSLKIVFNGSENPSANVKLNTSDLRRILTGDNNAAGLFLSGGIKLEGDMGLAMMLQTLLQ